MRSLLSNVLINFLEAAAQAPNPENQEFDWTLALLIAIGCFVVPVVLLSIFVIIKKIIKIFKRSGKKKKSSLSKDAFLALFGKDNVISVDTVMTRVIVEVKDVDLVNLEELKKLNVGILITGNVIKCSSEAYAELFK